MFNQQLLTGRRILVTGGGTGLGKSMAARFLELGAEVHICGRRKIVCDETATELMDLHGGRVVSHGVDIRNAMAVDEMIEAIWTTGPLTDLINNAAGNFISRSEELSPRGFDAVANIVMHGTFYVTQDRKSTRLNSSHVEISYAVFCLKKKTKNLPINSPTQPENETFTNN